MKKLIILIICLISFATTSAQNSFYLFGGASVNFVNFDDGLKPYPGINAGITYQLFSKLYAGIYSGFYRYTYKEKFAKKESSTNHIPLTISLRSDMTSYSFRPFIILEFGFVHTYGKVLDHSPKPLVYDRSTISQIDFEEYDNSVGFGGGLKYDLSNGNNFELSAIYRNYRLSQDVMEIILGMNFKLN